MSEFDEWASNGGLDVKKFPMSNIYKDTDTRVACAAWDHQQSKIDELQGRIDEAEKWIESNRKTIALEYSGYTTEEYVDADEMMNILKGNKDEN